MKRAILPIIILMLNGSAFAQQPWDFLRPLSDIASGFKEITSVIVFLLSLAVFIIAAMAYRKNKSRKLLFVGIAFFFFAAKWAIKIIDIYVSPGYFLNDPSENIFELAILLLLFLAIFKK